MAAAEVPEGAAEELSRAGPAPECPRQQQQVPASSLRVPPVLLLPFQLEMPLKAAQEQGWGSDSLRHSGAVWG